MFSNSHSYDNGTEHFVLLMFYVLVMIIGYTVPGDLCVHRFCAVYHQKSKKFKLGQCVEEIKNIK